MTLVLARRFGSRIAVLSDTMISHKDWPAPKVFPGRLKSIVINKRLTLSYAGLSDQGTDVARDLRRQPPSSTSALVDLLLVENRRHNDELDFILCTHEPETVPRLVKISGGAVSEGADFYWIGNRQAASEISRLSMQSPTAENLPDYMTQDEADFRNRFLTYLTSGAGVRHGVGGAAIDCLCSQDGHCYQTHAGAFSWDTITVGEDDPAASAILNKTGMYHFTYNVCSPSERGQAILGLYLSQAETGYLYDPMNGTEPMKVCGSTLAEFAELVHHAATVLSRASS